MAKVFLQSDVAKRFANGVLEHEFAADNVRRLLQAMDQKFPGLAKHLSNKTAVAIDGEIFQDPFLESIQPDSEIYFLPMIESG